MEAGIRIGGRVPVPRDPRRFVNTQPLAPHAGIGLLLQPALPAVDLGAFMAAQAAWVAQLLLQHGALLFRGFGCDSAERLQALMQACAARHFDYVYRSTPRKRVGGAIFTSTEYPAEHFIPLHNEMSYTRSWPARLWLCCVRPADEGGATPLADSRAVWQGIPEAVRCRFRASGVRYVRNYGSGLDLPWQEVFQTDDPAQVEASCRAAGIDFEWRGAARLRTSQVCQAETVHPQTGETVWFNQAHLFHVSSLAPAVGAALGTVFDADELPRSASFGDGSEIPPAMLDAVREAYGAEMVSLPWQAGDLVLLDNVRVAHGRMPFRGARRVVVGMSS